MSAPRLAPRLVLAGAAGLSLALALPGPALAPLVLVVPGLLRRAISGLSGRRSLVTGWFAGLVLWLAAVPWIVIVLHRFGGVPSVLAVLALVLMAAVLGLTWAAACWAASRTPAYWRPWTIPLALTAMEVMQGIVPWNFPWNPVAAVVTPWPSLLGPLPVVGAAGLSFLVLLAGGALEALLAPELRTVAAVQALVTGALFAATTALAPGFVPAGGPLTVAAVQPDVPLLERWQPGNEGEIEARVWRLSSEAVSSGAQWVVWPESAVSRLLERDAAYRDEITAFTRDHGVWMLLGSIGFDAEGEYYNSVYSVAPAGLMPFRYDKVHLVPFGEYVPIVGRIAFLRPLVHEVGSFTPGRSTRPLPGPEGPVGVAVCYEVSFPSLVAAEVRHGAEMLATITNDGWYGDSAAPRQHLALAVLRAAEARRYMIRAANTGISAVIDPYGGELTRLGLGRKGFITAAVRPGRGITPAVAWEPWLRAAPVALCLGAILFAERRRRALRRVAPGAGPSKRGNNAR